MNLCRVEGFYDLRITAELWETYYYDQLALMTVDHPAGTDIFVDERFVIPPAKLAITTVEKPRKLAHAVDDGGNDVMDIVSALDEKYLDNFGRGRYQGVSRDHYVEVDLGEDAPQSGPLWLIAKGWMHPTDSSINVAISQGQEVRAQSLSMEVPDGKGGWDCGPTKPGFSGWAQEDLPLRSDRRVPPGHTAALATADKPRNLLGLDRVGDGSSRYPVKNDSSQSGDELTCTIAVTQ